MTFFFYLASVVSVVGRLVFANSFLTSRCGGGGGDGATPRLFCAGTCPGSCLDGWCPMHMCLHELVHVSATVAFSSPPCSNTTTVTHQTFIHSPLL